jgi:predicted MFS family arabinose efflux permease
MPEQLPHPASVAARMWNTPATWLREQKLGMDFWIFFLAAFFYDAGFGIYFFLFNLFLLDLHFDERAIGLINGALSLGLLVGTLPIGIMSRRIGARPLLRFCFLIAPVLCVLRALWMWEPAQIGLAFTSGLVMSVWVVCFLPVTASLTTENNRASAMGLIFSVGIGATAIGAAVSGYLSQPNSILSAGLSSVEMMRIILLASSGIAVCGAFSLPRLPDTRSLAPREPLMRSARTWTRTFFNNAFLRSYLPCMALWSSLLAVFTTFSGVYLEKERHLSLASVGLIFSFSRLVELLSGLTTPLVLRALGILKGILATQVATALLLASMVIIGNPAWCVAFFLGYSAAQWMSSPALYTLLMNEVPEEDRASAAAMTMFTSSLVTAGATSAVGVLLVRYSYTPVLIGIAGFEAALAILFRFLMRHRAASVTVPGQIFVESATD